MGLILVFGFIPSGSFAQNTGACPPGASPSINDLKTTSPRCGMSTGEVSLTATGGTGTLSYSIDGTAFQSQPLFRNLTGGNYTVYVRDTKGCASTKAVSLPVSFSVGITDIIGKPATCGQTNGSLTVTTAGGNGAMQYSADGRTFQASSTITDLRGGTYTVQIRDGAGCTATQTIRIAGGPVIDTVRTTAPHCGTANGELTVDATGGVSPLTYAIDENTYQANARFTNLPGGPYTVYVRDASGCQINKAVTVPRSNPLILLNTDIVPTTCGLSNGRVSMIVTGGVKPIRFSTDGRRAQTSNTFDSLRAGTYTLFAQDSVGCTAGRSVTVATSSLPTITELNATPEACGQKNASITVLTAEPTSQYTFSVDGRMYQSGNVFQGLSGGAYTVSVRDQHNCISTRPVSLAVDCARVLHLPTAFSPNADNVNDAFTTYFSFPSLTVVQFVVYDRWGSIVYSRANFTLTNGEPIWNGQIANGTTAPAGTYSYTLHCRFPDDSHMTYNQSVALVK